MYGLSGRGPGEVMLAAAVLIAGEEFAISPERPFVFGRADADDVIGLDATDMGISAVAGSVECAWGLWMVLNRSRKRPLLLDDGGGGVLQRLDCGHRHAINVPRLSILVPGVIYTHRLEVAVPAADLAPSGGGRRSSGTITGDVTLSERDRDVLVALLGGYLEEFPAATPGLGPITRRPSYWGHLGPRPPCASRWSGSSSGWQAAACTARGRRPTTTWLTT